MSIDILNTDDIQLLRKTAKSMGIKITNFDNQDAIKRKIAEALGDLGYTDTEASDDAKEKAKESAVNLIMSGKAELGGLSPFPKDLPRGRLPNLLPFQNPWGGRRRRVRRIRRTESDQQILFVHWNGYPYVIGLEADYADMPYPHYLILRDATTEKMRQKKILDDEGRANWKNEFYEIQNFPLEDMGVTPGTEQLPRSMKEYLYSAYIEGFEGFTPMMWKQIAQAYNESDKSLGITPSMNLQTQISTRRMAIMDQLGMIDFGDEEKYRKDRVAVVAEILSLNPIADKAA